MGFFQCVAALASGVSGGAFTAPRQDSATIRVVRCGTRLCHLLACIAMLAMPGAARGANTDVGSDGADTTDPTVYSGANSITKIGTNTVTLTGNSTYSAGTTVNAGTLQFSTAANIGTGSVTLNGGALAYAGSTGSITRAVAVNTAGSGFGVTTGSTLTWLGAFSSPNTSGSLALTGGGTLLLQGNYDNNVNGIRVDAGTTLRADRPDNFFLLGWQRGTGGGIDAGLLEIGATGTVLIESPNQFDGGVTKYNNNDRANTPVQIEGGTMRFVDTGSGQINTIGKFTFVNGGTLDIQGNNRVDLNSLGGIVSSGTGAATISGASGELNLVKRASGTTPTIDVDAAAPLTIEAILKSNNAGNATGGLGITKTGTGTLILTGANSYTTTTISAGTIQVGNGGTTGTLGTGAITNNAALEFNRSGSLTVSSAISGTGSVTNTAAGTVVLSGNNSYAGGTTISAGTIQAGSSTAFGTGGVVNDAEISASSGDITLSNAISGSGLIAKATTGTLTLSGTNTFSGGLTISAGTVAVAQAAPLGSGTVRFTAPGSFTATSADVTFGNAFDLGSVVGLVTLTAPETSTTVLDGAITGGAAGTTLRLTSPTSGTNSGVFRLNGNSSFLGTLDVFRGPVVLGNASAAGNSTIKLNANNNPAGDLQFGASGFTIANSVQLANAGVANWIGVPSGETNGISGVISGNGFTKIGAGTLVLAGDNTYTGGTVFTAGTLQVGNGGAAGSLGSGDVSNAGSLVFNRTGSLTVGGIISGAGSLTQAGTGTTVLTASNTYTGTTTISAGTLQVGSGGTSTLGGTGAISNDGTLAFNIGNTQTLSRAVTGSGSLSKAGTGSLTLSGINTYTGGTTISGGELIVAGASGLGSGQVRFTAPSTLTMTDTNATFANAFDLGSVNGTVTLVMSAPSSTVIDGPITGGGPNTTLFFTNPTAGANTGVLTLNGNNSFQGTLQVFRGPLVLGNASAAGSSTIVLEANNNPLGDLQFGASGFTIPNNVTLSNPGGAGRDNWIGVPTSQTNGISGVISGTSFRKIGAGTLMLEGNNTYTGVTTIAEGTLQVGNAGAAGSLGSGNVSNAGSLVFNRTGSLTVGNTISGVGSLTQAGPGTVVLTGTNTYSGGTTLSSGTLNLGSAGAIGTTGTISFGGGVLQYSASNTTDYSSRFSNASTQLYSIDTNSQSVTLAQNLTSSGGVFTKLGTGTLTLTGTNTYSGGTQIDGGVLSLGSSDAIGSSGTISFGGGTLQFSSSNTTDYSSRFSTAASQAFSIDTNSENVSLATGLTSAGGTLAKSGAGTLTLTQDSAYSGTTTISAGTLQVGNGSTTGSLGSGAVTNNGSLVVNRSDAIAVANAIGGTGSLVQAGAGTTTLSGTVCAHHNHS
jgi:fibronectin-binding autotransporter adhesin